MYKPYLFHIPKLLLLLSFFVVGLPITLRAESPAPPNPPTTKPTDSPPASQPTTPSTQKPKQPKPKYIPGEKTSLTILFTNDLYGQIREFRCERKGVKGAEHKPAETDFANLLHVVNQQKKAALQRGEPPPLLLNTGDNVATSLASRFLLRVEKNKGTQFLVDVMRRFRYDFLGIGNHEFSVSTKRLDAFLKRATKAGLRFGASNLVVENKEHPIAKYVNREGSEEKKYTIVERAGFKIGIFHVVPNEFEKEVSQHRVKGITFKDPKEVADEIVTELREKQKVNYVIALTHLETRNSQGTKLREFLNDHKGINLVITNELRSKDIPMSMTIADPKKGNVHVVGGYRYGTHLGSARIKLKKNSEGEIVPTYFQVKWFPVDGEKYNKPLRKELLSWEEKYCDLWGSPLGKGRIRSEEGINHEDFTKYMLDIIRYLTKTEVAFINAKAIKEAFFPIKGYITRDDIFRVMPFNEQVTVMRLKGSTIKSLFDSYNDPKEKRKKLIFAGIQGDKINGREVQDNQMYSVATIRFIAQGAEGWLEKDPKRKLTDPIGPQGYPLRLRFLLEYHFEKDLFFEYRKKEGLLLPTKIIRPKKTAAQSTPDASASPTTQATTSQPTTITTTTPPQSPTASSSTEADEEIDIPYRLPLVRLEDKVAWRFSNNYNINFLSIFVTPQSISTIYNQKDTFNGGFFQKFNLSATANFKFQMDTRVHLWITQANFEYEADTSLLYNKDDPNVVPQIFQENNDRITLKTEYHFRYFSAFYSDKPKWYHTSPFAEFTLETEFTRGSRPNLSLTDFFKENNEVFRHFETRAKAGLSFKFAEPLTFKIGFAWRKEWALELELKPGITQAIVNTDHSIGLSVDYELTSIELFKVGETPLKYESTANYLFTFIVTDRPNQPAFDLHELTWDNKLSFAVLKGLELVLGFRMVVFKGAFRQDTTQENSPMVSGPVAFRFEPRLSIRYEWGARGQSL